jgi:outer membrane protein, heavy metal efflux system
LKTSRFHAIHGFGRAGFITLILLGGCQRPQISAQPELAAEAAAGLDNAIVFDQQGGPLDAARRDDDTLTLVEATRLALATHPGIQAALSQVRAAQADAHQARLLPNPILSFVLRFPEGGGSPIIEAGLAADLIAVLQRAGRSDAADSRLRVASARAVERALDVIAEVQDRYYGVQSSQALLPLMEKRRDLIARLRELAQSRLDVGEGSRLDVVTLDAQRVAIESEIDDLLLELTEQRLSLSRLIGRPSGDLNWRVADWQSPVINGVQESVWIDAALENRPELQQRVWELTALGVEVRLSRFGPWQGSSLGVNSERDGGWSVGPALDVPLPLFDWGQARRARVEAQRLEARHLLTQTQREVVEQVRRAAAVFNESVHELQRVRTQLIPLQEQRRELTEAAFRAGQTDVTTVVLSEQDLAAARARGVQLERRNSTALLQLERAVGGPGVAAMLIRSAPAATSPGVAPVTSPAATQLAPATRPSR